MFFDPNCPEPCNGCRHRYFTEEESLQKKSAFLQKKLSVWNDYFNVIRSVHGEARRHYRKKVCLHTVYNGKEWEFGMISHRQFVATPDCPVQYERIGEVIRLLSKVLPPPEKFPLHFFIQSGNQVMLVLKTACMPDNSWLGSVVEEQLRQLGVEGCWLHLNPSAGNKIFMKHNFSLLFGSDVSIDEQGMCYGPMSFQQLIPELYFDSLHEAAFFLCPGRHAMVIDLYCGTGYSMKKWVSAGSLTAGVELNGEAVACALKNVPGALIFRGKCQDRLPQLIQWADEHKAMKKLLYVNPPRTGLEQPVLQWIAHSYQPERMAYLSCSAGTLARDLDFLCSKGFDVEKIIPYDFFPQTLHVECLVLLSRTLGK
ncbi:MAG TPA: hypothetical protein PLI16_02240 [Bacteroidales bacterium]|nr:hypothetical protein [Bacteroidales bacterium]HOH83408.1 hypothetical protein [Bacteroidales bacterium]HPI29381.1 hypothetical protein [Bacteroidales bacterium]